MEEIGLKVLIRENNIIAKMGNNDKRTLIFHGYYDTVEAFKGWTKDPFGGEIIDGKIYGRGHIYRDLDKPYKDLCPYSAELS